MLKNAFTMVKDTGCLHMDYLPTPPSASNYLLSVSPGRKLRNQNVKPIPTAREEKDVYVVPRDPEPGYTEQEAVAPNSVKVSKLNVQVQ